MLQKTEMVPEEGFTEEETADKKKKFTCKKYSHVFPKKQSVKRHIAQVHEKEVLKRTRNKTEEADKEKDKKSQIPDSTGDEGEDNLDENGIHTD